MNKSEILSAIKAGRVNRRDLMKLMSAAGVTMAMMPVSRAHAADEVINFTWEGYNEPGFHPAYTAKHGAEPEGPYFADTGEALAKIRSGFRVDVSHPCSSDLKNWRDAGVIQPIDTSRLTHFGDLFSELVKLDYAQGDNGEQFFIPIDWGNTSILYRSDLFDVKEESWGMLWDERYAGQLSMGGEATESFAIAGILIGAADPFNLTDDEIAKAKELLVKQKPLLRFYWDSNATVEQALASGELVAATGWNSSVVELKGQGVPVKFANPKEGIMSYCCGLVLMKDARNIDKAYDLIDAMIDPEAGKWLIDLYGYGHANKKAFEITDDKMLADRNLPKDPSTFFANGIFQGPIMNPEAVNRAFEEVKAGA